MAPPSRSKRNLKRKRASANSNDSEDLKKSTSDSSPRKFKGGNSEDSQSNSFTESAKATDPVSGHDGSTPENSDGVSQSRTQAVQSRNVTSSSEAVQSQNVTSTSSQPFTCTDDNNKVADPLQSNQAKKLISKRVLKSLTNTELGFVEDEDGIIRLDDIVVPAAPAPALTDDVPDSRLVITHLTVRNFKSYAGEQVIGQFHKNFTAVVGPNGSGKSNVIDALIFVFGTKAKNIRAKKISALIHKSSDHPNVQSCSVAVNFAIIRDTEVGEGTIEKDSRFIVSRTVNKDGSSYYEICNKRVQQKEVIRTLRAYGIDLEYNRFLIMQGEIESISLMNPKATNEHDSGMLEYIEDIIGSNRLIQPIKYLENKVEQMNGVVKEKEKELQLYEKEKTELEGPMKKAVEFLRTENKLFLCENSLYHYQRNVIEDELKDIIEKKEKSEEDLRGLITEIKKIAAGRNLMETEMSKLKSEYEAQLKKVEDYTEKYKELERQDAANLIDIKHAKSKTQSLQKSLEEGNVELEKLKKQVAVYEQETEELVGRKKKLEEEKIVDEKKASEVMSSLKNETTLLQEKKDKLESKLIQLKEIMYQSKSELDLSKSELELCLSSETKEKDKLEKLIAEEKNASECSRKEAACLKEEEAKIKTIGDELETMKSKLSDAKESEINLTQQWRNERMKLEDAKSSQQTSQNSSSLLQGLMREKSNGRLPGIYGRLGDLGAIDEKYDVAISTACGRLDNIVTDTLTTAQACVEYLKHNNLGYATFIALDQMRKWEPYVHQKISAPENVPRLFDLIRVKDQSLLTAFYFALGNTLVARDLEQATRIGLQGRERHRVVTLKGEVIDLAGTMSGGGGRVSRGRMGQTVVENTFSREDFERMSAEVESLGRKVSETKRQCSSLEDKIAQMTSQLQSLTHSIRKRKMHSKAYQESAKTYADQVADQRKVVSSITVDEKRIRFLEKEIRQKNKKYLDASGNTSQLEEEIAKMQSEILSISKGKLGKAKKTVEQFKKKLDEVTQAVTKSTVNAKQAHMKIKKLETKLENMTKDFEYNKKALKELREKQETLTARGTELTELISENKSEFSKYKEKQAVIKKAIEEVNEKEHQLKRDEIEHKNSFKQFEAAEAEKRAVHRSISAKISKLRLNQVEDDPTYVPELSKDEISKLSIGSLTSEIDVLKVKLEDMKPDLSAVKEYQKKVKLFEDKKQELKRLEEQRNLESRRYHELRRRRLAEFMSAFAIIASKLKEIYQMLTLGGDAELELVESNDPFLKGIEFSVRPPKKSWKLMRNLSGGEKTLSSLALVFALHYYRPTPFYVMDEIDAALDVRNVAIVGYFLKKHTKNAQFLVVSLRNEMNEISDHLLGIYKVDNCTKSISVSDAQNWK